MKRLFQSPSVTSKPIRSADSYGLGNALLDPAGGEVAFTARIKAEFGADVGASPYDFGDVQLVANFLLTGQHDSVKRVRFVGGDSYGANNTMAVADLLDDAGIGVDFAWAFQPSVWNPHILVPSNVKRAICIYNPNWFATLGLGDYPWQLAPDNDRTQLQLVTTTDMHPGDNDVAMQDMLLAQMKRVIDAAG